MSVPSFAAKHYTSAHKRLLEARVAQFFETNFPRFFGPDIRKRIAQQLLELIEEQFPAYTHLRPGQCLWGMPSPSIRAPTAPSCGWCRSF